MASSRWSAASASALLVVLAACSGSGGDAGGETVRAAGAALTIPDGFAPADDGDLGGLVLAYDAEVDGERVARIGITTVDDAPDPDLYLVDTSALGAAARGLEPEVHREETLEVDGADAAELLEWSYTGPESVGSPRVRVLQVVAIDADRTLYDVRYEAVEPEYDAEVADTVASSVALTG